MHDVSPLRILVPWLAILVLAFVNGALRELWLVPQLGYPGALLLSGGLLCACVVLVTWLAMRRFALRRGLHALGLGAVWLAMTLVFEFGFGRAVQHKSWQELLAAYGFERGNLWPLVLLVILFGPAVAWWLQSRHTAGPAGAPDGR